MRLLIGSSRCNQGKYEQWLKGLKFGDECLLQMFRPHEDSKLFPPCEGWVFKRGKYQSHLRQQFVAPGDVYPLNETGGVIYYGSAEPWGDVFQARIVPVFHFHEEIETQLFSTPVYEPSWNAIRHYYLDAYGPNHGRSRRKLKEAYALHYERNVTGGTLYTVFDPSWQDAVEIDGLKYLYSEETRT